MWRLVGMDDETEEFLNRLDAFAAELSPEEQQMFMALLGTTTRPLVLVSSRPGLAPATF